MGILDSIERGLERAVNGAFAKTFRSGLQPVDISSALRRELDTRAAVISRDRILVPNVFTVKLNPEDFERMNGMGSTLTDELTRVLTKHAQSHRFQFAGGISITLKADPSLALGVVNVQSENASGSITWVAVLEINGKRYPLEKSRTVIGRGTEADITVDDAGISRKHVEILWDGTRAQANDLGSTNGSQLNGKRLTSAGLEPDAEINIGQTSIILRVIPRATPEPRSIKSDTEGFWAPA